MNGYAKGGALLSALLGISVGAFGLVAGYPFSEQTFIYQTADVRQVQLSMHSSTVQIHTDPQADSIVVSIRGKRQDVKNTKVSVIDGMLSVTGVANLARNIEVTVTMPEGGGLDYAINIHSGVVGIENLESENCTVTGNNCQVTINNVEIGNLHIDNDNGTVMAYGLSGGTHHIKSNYGTVTINDSSGYELIVESEFGKVTGRQIHYETVTPIGGSDGVMDIQ